MALTKANIMEKKDSPKFTIEFSFDDGYKADLQIAQILEKHGLKGTFYVIVDCVGKEGFLTWDDIKDLDRRGHMIGSHTISHPSDLKILYDQDLHYEVQNSKDLIENVLGHNISKFCYPRGRYDERVKAFVARAGYVHARVTGKVGNVDGSDSLALPGTIHIFQREEYGNVSILDFAKQTIDRVKQEGGYCNIWGHGSEITKFLLFNTLDEICAYVVKN